MYQNLLAYFAHNKYRLMMFFLLAGATIFSVAIWRVRSEFSGTIRYGFLIWNLFLAWIPYWCSVGVLYFADHGSHQRASAVPRVR